MKKTRIALIGLGLIFAFNGCVVKGHNSYPTKNVKNKKVIVGGKKFNNKPTPKTTVIKKKQVTIIKKR